MSTCVRSFLRLTPWLVALVTLLPWTVEPVAAASVQLTVLGDDGSLGGRPVRIVPRYGIPRAEKTPTWMLWQPLSLSGTVRFDGLPLGTYTVELRVANSGWVPLAQNPLRPPPTFTVRNPTETVQLQVEVMRGMPVRLYLDLPVNVDGFQARFRHRATGATVSAPLYGDGRETVRLLPRGVWEVEVLPRQGFLLTQILVDRQDWLGSVVVLDLLERDLPPDITFSFVAPVKVEGSVSAANAPRPAGVQVQATLLEAGPWLAAAQAREARIPWQVIAGLDPNDDYELWLPTGTWRLEPVGDRIASSDPEGVERALADNDFLRADFVVEMELGDAPDDQVPLRVRVVDKVAEAERQRRTVELEHPFRGRLRRSVGPRLLHPVDAVALDEGESRRWQGRSEEPLIVIPDLEAGTYTVVAGHEDSLEGQVTVSYDPSETPESLPVIELEPGASVELLATNVDNKRVADAELKIERLDELPELWLSTPAFLDSKRGRILRTDLSGRATAAGFYGGQYRFEPRLARRGSRSSIVELRATDGGSRWAPSLEMELEESGTVEIQIRERPAAQLEATLECSDAWRLPETLSVRLLDGWRLDSVEPIVQDDALQLLGRRRDLLRLGPLDTGTYVVGLRPEGFDRWTWVYGASTPEDAEGITIEEGDRDTRRTLELGPLQVECGPAVDLLPRVASNRGGEAPSFPELREVRMTARTVSEATEKGLKDLDLKPVDGRIEMRGMVRGEQVLEITLEHPWFLPAPELLWEVPMELEKGMYRQLELTVDALGGALDLRDLPPTIHAVRASRDGQEPIIVGTHEGRAFVPSLVPGTWSLALCNDTECTSTQPAGDVTVGSGETVRYP